MKQKEFQSIKKYFEILEKLYTNLKELEKNNSNILLELDINKINKSLIIQVSEQNTLLVKEGQNISSVLNFNLLPKMSSGNIAIMQIFSMLYDKLKDIKDENILLLLDEVEVYLHPNWQKKILKLLIGFLSSKFKDKNFHIILATHSPFLLSDIPKSNVVFLGDNPPNNQTFGANIHTLLSDSFFMEDGLMGEFAKSKINEIADFHKLVEKNRHINCLIKIYLHSKQKKFWDVQKIIGEEYLKQVIKNHLVEIEKKLLGQDEAKKEEIKRVEAYLESLKK